jgi:hypothetical protein
MSNTNTGGSAFPTERNLTQGMTLRDYFAAKAMQALMTRSAYDAKLPVRAYEYADAMIQARSAK